VQLTPRTLGGRNGSLRASMLSMRLCILHVSEEAARNPRRSRARRADKDRRIPSVSLRVPARSLCHAMQLPRALGLQEVCCCCHSQPGARPQHARGKHVAWLRRSLYHWLVKPNQLPTWDELTQYLKFTSDERSFVWRALCVAVCGIFALTAMAQGADQDSPLRRLSLERGTGVVGTWERLPTIRVGVVRSAGELTFRVGSLVTASGSASGVHVTLVVSDLTATTYLDHDELRPLIDAITSGLEMPIQPERKQVVREVAFETRGRFRFAAKQTGGEEPDFRFMIFVPDGLTGLPRFPEEFRSDGPAGVLVPHVLRGDPNDAENVRKALLIALEKLKPAA
jgi:hypothetical protein